MTSCRLIYRGLLITGMFLLGLLAVALVMPGLRRVFDRQAQPWCEAIVQEWDRAVCRILHLKLHVTGHPDPPAGLVVANHISWLDIIAMGAQQPCVFVAKEDVAGWPIMGTLAKGIGTLFVRRGDAEQSAATSETMTWLLRRGTRLMLFPEGTTTRGEQVLRFHGKLFQPAQRAGANVQAVALRYTGRAAEAAPFVGDDEFLPHLLQILTHKEIDLHIHYCPTLPAGLRRDQLAKTSRLQITEHLYPATGRLEAMQRVVTQSSPEYHIRLTEAP
jgi:1-acyl-sn-glycerol-3-phosphate acyltransferase